MPLSDTFCGLDAPLSVNEMAPVRVPDVVGVKVTEIVQLALAARLDPQLFVSAKFLKRLMPLIEREAVPVLVKVTACAALVVATVWLANVRLVDDKLTTGAVAATAVPLSETFCGLDAPLSVNEMAPVSVPEAVGVNVTEIVQLALAARLDPQLFVSAKLAEGLMPLIEREALPVLVKVTLCAGLVVATVWLAKVRLVDDKLTTGLLELRLLACANVTNVEPSTIDTRSNFLITALSRKSRNHVHATSLFERGPCVYPMQSKLHPSHSKRNSSWGVSQASRCQQILTMRLITNDLARLDQSAKTP